MGQIKRPNIPHRIKRVQIIIIIIYFVRRLESACEGEKVKATNKARERKREEERARDREREMLC